MAPLAAPPVVAMAPTKIRIDTIVFCTPWMPIGEADVFVGVDQSGTDARLGAVDARCGIIVTITAHAGDLAIFDDDGAIGEHGAIGLEYIAAEPQGVVSRCDATRGPGFRLRSRISFALLGCDRVVFTPVRWGTGIHRGTGIYSFTTGIGLRAYIFGRCTRACIHAAVINPGACAEEKKGDERYFRVHVKTPLRGLFTRVARKCQDKQVVFGRLA